MQTEQQQIAQLEREVSELKVKNQELQIMQAAKQRKKPFAWRSLFCNGLLSLGILALIPAGMLLWLNRTVVQPDSYIASVGPVIQQPAVQKAIQETAAKELSARVDVNQIVSQALPENAQMLVGPISAQVKNYTYSTIGTIVASPKFAEVWVKTNRQAQASFMKIANNSSGSPDINLGDLYTYISDSLQSTKLAGLAGKQLPPSIGNIHIATVPALERIPHFVSVLNTWRWVMVGLAIGLLGLAVALAKDRRRMFIWVGFGIIGAVIVTLVIVRITRGVMLGQITDTTYNQAAVAVWQTILNPFLIQISVTALLGLAIAMTGWLLGPGKVAAGTRRTSQQTLAGWRVAILPQAESTSIIQFARRHHQQLLWWLLGLTIISLLLLIPLTIGTALSVIAIAILALLLLEFLTARAKLKT
jgi:hypothetical protein